MVLVKFSLLLSLMLLIGCSKVAYVFDQARGQLSLLNRAKPNQEVLHDVQVKKEHKQKISNIMEYKKFFFSFFNEKEQNIYSKTTMLNREAVTFLVIRSPLNKIEGIESCFPILGCFPYLGFFSKSSAEEFVQERQSLGESVWMRNVYAYSTLGYVSDPILSSFFQYDDFDLAELIFHELFHVIFFIKGEVELNENLANFFARKMKQIYFVNDTDALKNKIAKDKRHEKLRGEIARLAQELSKKYSKDNASTEQAKVILESFIESTFNPQVRTACKKNGISNCYPLTQKWNNAHFAAFMTYEAKKDQLDNLFKKLQLDLRGFFNYIKEKHSTYQTTTKRDSFETYLFN